MKIVRSTLVSGLILIFCTVAWAAKKERTVVSPERIVTKSESAAVVTTNKSVTLETPVGTSPDAVAGEAVVPSDPAPDQVSGTAAYQIPWQSVNGGGAPSASTNYQVSGSVGQSSIGYATSTNYQAGIGYWYGATASSGGCSCPFQSDYDEDGFLTAIDLGSLIDVLFAGKPEITDPDCPKSRGDFDCDGFPTAIDLGLLIDHLFAGGPPPNDPCSP